MTPPNITDDDDLVAAELALGLLTEAEVATHRARVAAEPALADRVEWWRAQFGPLAQVADAEVPAGHWDRISARLPANDNASTIRRWQGLSALLGAVAAALLIVLVTRSPVAPPLPAPQGPQLAASLSGEAGNAVAITYDDASRRMAIMPVKLDAGPGDAELWVIPKGATVPVSLGVINASGPEVHLMDAAQAEMMDAGATFAITQEPRGGSPTGKATGPIVASGKVIST